MHLITLAVPLTLVVLSLTLPSISANPNAEIEAQASSTVPTDTSPATGPNELKPIAPSSNVDPAATPTYTFPNPPPPPPKGTSSVYLFSLKHPQSDFTAFDFEFNDQISQANYALNSTTANSIGVTLHMKDMVAYTCNITIHVYEWLLHDPRLKTFDADGSGHTADPDTDTDSDSDSDSE